MKRCHINDGNNEALGIDVAIIDVVGLSTEIGAPPVEELLSVTSVVESDSRLNGTLADSNSEVAIIGSSIQPSAIAVYPRNYNVNSLLRNNEDTLMGSDETVSSSNSNSEVAIIGHGIQPSAIAVYPRNDNVNSLLRNNEDTLLMGSDETVSSSN